MERNALILGATGLVGTELLTLLLDKKEYAQIFVLSRSKINMNHPKLVEIICNLDEMDKHPEAFKVDDVFCCLGTTMKKAGSRDQFSKVDYTYPLTAAKLAETEKAEQFLVVSAMGANVASRVFYNKVKGKMEEDIKNSAILNVHIFRPSLLLGKREEFRFGEKMAEWLFKPFKSINLPFLSKYSPIEAKVVAKGMVAAALKRENGLHLYESNTIKQLSKGII